MVLSPHPGAATFRYELRRPVSNWAQVILRDKNRVRDGTGATSGSQLAIRRGFEGGSPVRARKRAVKLATDFRGGDRTFRGTGNGRARICRTDERELPPTTRVKTMKGNRREGVEEGRKKGSIIGGSGVSIISAVPREAHKRGERDVRLLGT